ncbi:MAG: hypothetical protein ACRC28_06320 [Clostridium sp.]|uniref:hypothetical protein n=1 Tax=Clostridium sp. TaxID=1506 RepID=UPI003F331D94
MFELYNDVIEICREAALIPGFKFDRLFQMINGKGALLSLREIIRDSEDIENLEKLIEAGREDLTIEALVLSEKYKDEFTEEDKTFAKSKLNSFKNKEQKIKDEE